MASVLLVTNTTTQAVAANGQVNLGSTTHKSCQSQAVQNGNAIYINGTGYFNVEVNASLTGSSGDASIQLYADGVAIPSAYAVETIGTASTEFHTLSFSMEVLKRCNCSSIMALTLVNTGVAANIAN